VTPAECDVTTQKLASALETNMCQANASSATRPDRESLERGYHAWDTAMANGDMAALANLYAARLEPDGKHASSLGPA
jgi:hypothetical protein